MFFLFLSLPGSYHGFSSGMQPNPIGAHRVDMVHGTITGPSGLSTPSSGTLVLTGGKIIHKPHFHLGLLTIYMF